MSLTPKLERIHGHLDRMQRIVLARGNADDIRSELRLLYEACGYPYTNYAAQFSNLNEFINFSHFMVMRVAIEELSA